MNIKEAAEACGLPTKTIRYYDDIGLIQADRQANGYRSYDETTVQQLTFVRRLREIGFSIADCRQLLSLWRDENRASADVKELARKRLEEIDERIEDLRNLRNGLNSLIDLCPGDAHPSCPILDGLSRPA